jgi:DNA (cytosine-5)-methyltransferase 1
MFDMRQARRDQRRSDQAAFCGDGVMKRLLDLFCGAGGAGMGCHRAGFEVIGVDIKPMPRYPFEFHLADALEYLAAHGHEFDVIHASPPCQEYSQSRHLRNSNAELLNYQINIKEKLVDDVREALLKTGKPWVIENVPGSPLPEAIELCGTMFGLPLLRHRWFASSILLFAPMQCNHPTGFYNAVGGKIRGYGIYSSGKTYLDAKGSTRKREGYPGKAIGVKTFDIDWMTVAEMCESIPPIYTEYIGAQLLRAIQP